MVTRTVRFWTPLQITCIFTYRVITAVNITRQILRNVQKYQLSNSADQEAYVQRLVGEGRRIRGLIIGYHSARWTFGPWDDGVRFPSLHKNGVLVASPRR